MSEFEDLKNIIRDLLTTRFAPKPAYTRGLMGDGLGNVVVPDKDDFVYVRFGRGSTEFFEVFNRTVNPIDGWPILIGELPWQPGLTQVVATDWSAYEQAGWGGQGGGVAAHAFTHEWPDGYPGSDPVSIHMRSIVPLRGYVQGSGSVTFYANSLEYQYLGTGTTWAGVPGLNVAAPLAALSTGQAQMLGIYLDPGTNTLAAVTGTIGVFTDAFDPPRPTFPASVLPVAWLRIYGSQAGLVERDIRDARRLFLVPYEGGQDRRREVVISEDYAALSTDEFIFAGATGTTTVTLPSAAGLSGKMMWVKKTDATLNDVTIAGAGAETIDGAATQTLDTQYKGCQIISDGSNWHIVNFYNAGWP